MEFLGEAALAVADFVVFRLVHFQGHQFEVCDDVVEFGDDGPGNDVIHTDEVAGVGAESDDW